VTLNRTAGRGVTREPGPKFRQDRDRSTGRLRRIPLHQWAIDDVLMIGEWLTWRLRTVEAAIDKPFSARASLHIDQLVMLIELLAECHGER
jgi:hypothetical protein